jgi:type I restriction enzyme S subunit
LLLRRIDSQRRAQWEEQSREVETKKKPKYQEPQQIDNPKLYKLPTGWTWVTLDEIGQEGRPIIYGIIKPGPHIPDGVPYVRVTEMKDGFIDVSLLRKTSVERVRKFSRATLKAGDLLISKDGTIGRVAVVPPELEGGNITQHVMRAPIHSFVNRNYIILAVQSPYCQGWLTGETRGVALQGVNVEDFRRLPIPLPPLSEQKQIVAEVERRLSVVGEVESAVDGGLVRAARLRQSVLKSAFEGRLL